MAHPKYEQVPTEVRVVVSTDTDSKSSSKKDCCIGTCLCLPCKTAWSIASTFLGIAILAAITITVIVYGERVISTARFIQTTTADFISSFTPSSGTIDGNTRLWRRVFSATPPPSSPWSSTSTSDGGLLAGWIEFDPKDGQHVTLNLTSGSLAWLVLNAENISTPFGAGVSTVDTQPSARDAWLAGSGYLYIVSSPTVWAIIPQN